MGKFAFELQLLYSETPCNGGKRKNIETVEILKRKIVELISIKETFNVPVVGILIDYDL